MAKTGQGGLEGIVTALPREKRKGLPPVHLWNPPFCGDIDMRIAADGTWFYQKTPIGRPALVKLFASVLKREGDRYFLVTPVEKVGIIVEDAPFLAVELQVEAEHRCSAGMFSISAPMSTTGSTPGPGTPCASSREAGQRRPQALSACAPRAVGQGDAGAVLRSGRARRGARRSTARRCSASPPAASSSPWRKRAPCGSSPDARSGGGAGDAGGRILRARARAAYARRAGGSDDPSITPTRGDHDADPVMEKIAAVRPIRPAAVLVPIVDHPEPTVLLTQRAAAFARSCRARCRFPAARSTKSDAQPAGFRVARGRRGDRPRPRHRRAARLSRSLHDHARLSHRAGGGAGRARLCAHAQHQPRSTTPSKCRSPS